MTCNCVLLPKILIFLKSGWPGEHNSPASAFLISGYGKKSNFRGGTSNLSIKSERGNVCRYHEVKENDVHDVGPRSRMVPGLSNLGK